MRWLGHVVRMEDNASAKSFEDKQVIRTTICERFRWKMYHTLCKTLGMEPN